MDKRKVKVQLDKEIVDKLFKLKTGAGDTYSKVILRLLKNAK